MSRTFFERILRAAVPSAFDPASTETRQEWQARVATSDVRLQWDPDHDPAGGRLDRRAIQLGLRGEILRAYAMNEIREVVDMTPFVAAQRAFSGAGRWAQLRTPVEDVYTVSEAELATRLGLDVPGALQGR